MRRSYARILGTEAPLNTIRQPTLAALLVLPAILVPAMASGAIQAHFSVPDQFHPARTLVLAEALLALVLALGVAWQQRRNVPWRALLLCGGITGIGLALRLGGSQWAWFHENRHGYGYFSAIALGGSGYLPPSTYYVLMNFATWLGPPREGTLLLVNALFSAATVPFLGLVARQVSLSPAAGWAAMGLWALSPYAIRLAATEIYFNVGLFFFTAAMAATLHALRRINNRELPITPLVLAALCAALAAQTRATTLLWPATVVLVALGAGEVTTRRRWLALAGLTAGIAFLLLPKVSLYLDGDLGGGRYLDPGGLFYNLRRLTIIDHRTVSALVAPLALLGGTLLIRGRRPLGIAATRALMALAAFPGILWGATLVTRVRCDGFICIPSVSFSHWREGIAALIGAVLAMALTRVAARSPRCALAVLPEGRRGGFVVLGVALPVITSAMITANHVARLRFDLVPTALLTILAGVGVAGVAALLPRRRGLAAAAGVALVLSALIPLPHLRRSYADPMEHRFLQQEVLPRLAELGDREVRIVCPLESTKSAQLTQGWWASNLADVRTGAQRSELEDPGNEGALYAYVGYPCAWSHGHWEEDRYVDEDGVAWSSPPPYPPAEHLEGAPRIHPACAAKLAGRSWRAVVTLDLPLDALEGNVARIHPALTQVTIGLYEAAPAVESLHTP
ncbi:MAG: hypothetical protein ABIK09_14890 [Pseudomonadota bacterium]